MDQPNDLLIERLEGGVKTLHGEVAVLDAGRPFEFLLKPLHQCTTPSRAAALTGQHLAGNTERSQSGLHIIAGQMVCAATQDEQGVAQQVGGICRRVTLRTK